MNTATPVPAQSHESTLCTLALWVHMPDSGMCVVCVHVRQGTPDAPQCGFSSMACQILNAYGKQPRFCQKTLQPAPRQQWAFDLVRERHTQAEGEALQHTQFPSQPCNRQLAISQHTATFPDHDAPCVMCCAGFKYGSRNVLADEGVREGIKKFTNWPTIPQVRCWHTRKAPLTAAYMHACVRRRRSSGSSATHAAPHAGRCCLVTPPFLSSANLAAVLVQPTAACKLVSLACMHADSKLHT